MVEKAYYKHYKGGTYEVLHSAVHTETGERLVIYRPVPSDSPDVWARPESMWDDVINGKKRFEKVVK